MKDYYDVTYPIIIMGDFNMKSITGLEHGYNAKLENYMRDNFNSKQIVKEDTAFYQSVLQMKTFIILLFGTCGQIIKL